MKEFGRRDFLKFTSILPFYGFYRHLDKYLEINNGIELGESDINPVITELGDINLLKNEGSPKDGTNGFRASFVSEDGRTILGGTEMGKYHLSNDFGENWKNCDFSIVNRPMYSQSAPRDIVKFTSSKNTDKLLLINDFNIDILFKGNGDEYFSENVFPIYGEGRTIQTAICLPNGIIVAGGNSLVGGIFTATEDKLLDLIKFNKLNESNKKEFYWENLYELGNPRQSLVRNIFFDTTKNVVYISGWASPDNRLPIGMGVLCLDAKNLNVINHPYNFKDDLGDMPVNTLNVIHYNDSEIVVQGMERSGIYKKEGYQEHNNTNFLKIWVNGKILDDQIVNTRRLAKYGNGWDIVSCGSGGTETIVINDKKYLAVCMLGGGICVVPLDDVVTGKNLNWQSITYAPPGQSGFNAFRAKTVTNPLNKKQELIVSRLSWKGGGAQRFARISF